MKRVLSVCLVFCMLLLITGCDEGLFDSSVLTHDWKQYEVKDDLPAFSDDLLAELDDFEVKQAGEEEKKLIEEVKENYSILNRFNYEDEDNVLIRYSDIIISDVAELADDTADSMELMFAEGFIHMIVDSILKDAEILDHLELNLEAGLIMDDEKLYLKNDTLWFPVIEYVRVMNIEHNDLTAFDLTDEQLNTYNDTVNYLQSITNKYMFVAEHIATFVDVTDAELETFKTTMSTLLNKNVEDTRQVLNTKFNLIDLYGLGESDFQFDHDDFDVEVDDELQIIFEEDDQDGIKIFINGVKTDSDVEPFIQDGRTMVPLRFIAEGLDAKVDWEPDLMEVIINKNGDSMVLTIDQDTFFFNDEEREMDAAPLLKDGRTMVPLRFVAESFDKRVDWDEHTNSVYIND